MDGKNLRKLLDRRSVHRALLVLLVAGALCAGLGPVRALINLRYTPADLVRGAQQIVVLEVAAPEKDVLTAKVVETLKGDAPKAAQLTFSLARADAAVTGKVAAAFETAKTARAVLFAGDFSKAKDGEEARPSVVLEIHTEWFTLVEEQGERNLGPDALDLNAVWAGSARLLAEAARYALDDPRAAFPVAAALQWGTDLPLGQLKGKVNGCLVADLKGHGEPCAWVFCDGGDRFYQAGTKDRAPRDVTAALAFASASRAGTCADFNGDGRLDLASWDGKVLWLAAQNEDGTFHREETDVKLEACLALAALDTGVGPGAGLLASTPGAPVLLSRDVKGGFVPRALAGPADLAALAKLGSGGRCVVADVNDDGVPDVLQFFAKGVAFYAGVKAGEFKPPVVTNVEVVDSPSAAVGGDFEGNGTLAWVVTGKDGCVLLRPGAAGSFTNVLNETAELAYHGALNRPPMVAASACDINQDGRQGVALFYAELPLKVFFNRGFGCFAFARELNVMQSELKGAVALQQGSATGAMLDLNGDGAEDVLAADPQGNVWALFGEAKPAPGLTLTLALPGRVRGPLTVTVSSGARRVGKHVLAPGVPVTIGRQSPGPVTLAWLTPDGKKHTRTVTVLRPTRVELSPEE